MFRCRNSWQNWWKCLKNIKFSSPIHSTGVQELSNSKLCVINWFFFYFQQLNKKSNFALPNRFHFHLFLIMFIIPSYHRKLIELFCFWGSVMGLILQSRSKNRAQFAQCCYIANLQSDFPDISHLKKVYILAFSENFCLENSLTKK